MATALRLLRVAEHTNRLPPALDFVQVRGGLIVGKHRKQMRESRWLYDWLLLHRDMRNGVITGYTHAAAAADLEASERTVQAWLAQLARYGYVEIDQRRYWLDVRITKNTPYKVGSGSQIPATLNVPESAQGRNNLRVESQIPAPRVADSCESISIRGDQRDQRSTTNVVASAAIPDSLAGFDRALRGSRGYQPKPGTLAKIAEKYGHLDLEEEALKMAGWLATKRTRPASDAFILNWLKGAAADAAAGRTYGAASKNGAHATGGRAGGRGGTLPADERERIRAARTGGPPVLH
jgi:hypothetical protein